MIRTHDVEKLANDVICHFSYYLANITIIWALYFHMRTQPYEENLHS